jgi:hypothetical protein
MLRHALALAPRRPSAPVLVVAPRRGGKRLRRRAAGAARAVGRRAVKHGIQHAPAMSLAIGGLVVGALDGRGLLQKIPTIGGSRAMTLGIAGYLATRFIKNPFVRNAGLAALAAAAYDYGKVHLGTLGGAPVAAPSVPVPTAHATHGMDEGAGAHDDDSRFRGDGGPY